MNIQSYIDNCYGCTACIYACQKNAIKFYRNEEGFLIPKVNQYLCNDCEMCLRVCPASKYNSKNQNLDNFIQKAFALRHRDEKILFSSTSGGAFTAISDYILGIKGVIFGAIFDEKYNVVHVMAKNEFERDKMRGSKYIQSNVLGIFPEVAKNLKKGKTVLFIGTPCQVNGLKNFLREKKVDTENLFLCDFICSGVSSPTIWKEYLNFLQKEYNSKIKVFKFRDKMIGWRGMNITVAFDSGRMVSNNLKVKSFAYIYSKGFILRESCYNCKFSKLNRDSDITIGDFWGVEKCISDFDDNKGVSLVLVNSKKGELLIKNIKERVYLYECPLKSVIQPRLSYPKKKPKEREIFWSLFRKHGFKYTYLKYIKFLILKDKIKRVIRGVIKKILNYMITKK